MDGPPEAEELVGTEAESLKEDTEHDGDEGEGDKVVHQVLVPELHILELDGVREVR